MEATYITIRDVEGGVSEVRSATGKASTRKTSRKSPASSKRSKTYRNGRKLLYRVDASPIIPGQWSLLNFLVGSRSERNVPQIDINKDVE